MVGGGGFRSPQMFQALAADPSNPVTELVLFDTDGPRLAVVETVIDQLRVEADGDGAAAGGRAPAVRTEPVRRAFGMGSGRAAGPAIYGSAL